MTLAKDGARSALNTFNRPFGKRRLQRSLREHGNQGCSLEIGAYETTRPGWIATDVTWRCKNYLDVTQTWPIDSNFISNIFADNVIEHLSLNSNKFLFKEAFRTLKPGGSIRLITPDIGALVEKYRQGWTLSADLVQQLISEGYLIAHGVDLLRFAFQDDGHDAGYLWDQDSLFTELSDVGFAELKSYELGHSDNPAFAETDSRTGTPIGRVMLTVEATKSL